MVRRRDRCFYGHCRRVGDKLCRRRWDQRRKRHLSEGTGEAGAVGAIAGGVVTVRRVQLAAGDARNALGVDVPVVDGADLEDVDYESQPGKPDDETALASREAIRG